MHKTLIAMIVASTLAATPAAQAETDKDTTLARIAVGLTAALVLAQLMSSDTDDTSAAILPQTTRDRGGLTDGIAPPVTAPGGARIGADWTGTRLPRSCRVGNSHYDGDCLRDQLPDTSPLPNICAERVMHGNRVRTLYHDGCLRAAGYR
ncbi:hypothetical protein SAMN05428995_101405 [Loktanella sp. DSM 29012]|uniref:hypothetical protein n=1 Tax=Loktanella sp. DSM 29012 TaxID=1881056 RepID=UPI0008BCB45C|nr:hypothetical protein [Loktanella sp. DSM 29012]SEP65220.1 hypothetical protein SAMN05428995_101405 [Loktanella sp. DSM 29012]